MDGYSGITVGMSVLTTTIERTVDLRIWSLFVVITYGYIGIIYPCQLVVDRTSSSDITS